MSKNAILTLLILIGLVAGALFGEYILFPSGQVGGDHWTKQLGDLILIRPLKLLVIPLIFFSVVSGITRIGDPSRLGLVGGATIIYYITTMLLAVILGTALVSWVAPGVSPHDQQLALISQGEAAFNDSTNLQSKVSNQTMGSAWTNILRQLIPDNVIKEMSDGRPLGVIVFAIGFGLALAWGRERTKAARKVMDACFEGMMIFVQWIIWLTPIGVFFLVSWSVGQLGLTNIAGPIGKYMLVVLVGLAIHGLIVLPIVLTIFGRTNPYQFLWQMRRALLTAFGTDSSSATLPVTMDTAENEGRCSKRASNFVLPLGSTINMDGTALYEAVAVVFLFQLYGYDLSMVQLTIVVITATLAAIGAAGIPSAGLVTMVVVISAVNTSLAPTGVDPLPIAAIGIILGVDRILDMCRTTVNVWGDATGAKIISRLAPDEPVSDASDSDI
ncbi:MAG: dicarboxylate/amino acid:cation symporter [Phycisphaerales bacterium]|nr:dicarboxylate/amino acid:cation symporter [Phycisphaerales bacterium]